MSIYTSEYYKKFINEETCVGDMEHNKYVNILFKGIKLNASNKAILDVVYKHYSDWIFINWTQEELRRLNVIMRTTNTTTYIKRCRDFISYLGRGSVYMNLFNKDKINDMFEVLYNKCADDVNNTLKPEHPNNNYRTTIIIKGYKK